MIKNLRIHDQTLFFLGSIGILSGIFLTNVFHENTLFLGGFVWILSIQILFFFRSFLPYILVGFISFGIGGCTSIYTLQWIQATTQLLEKQTVFFTQEAPIHWTLSEKISENSKTARYVLRHTTIWGEKMPENLWILLSFPDGRGKEIGDIIAFTGKLSLPTNNEVFDYVHYLLLDDIFATSSVSFPDKIGKSDIWRVQLYVLKTRTRFLSLIEDIYPWESAKLLQGMLIGERANLLEETKKSFNTSGLTHIIAVSGFNITIILIFLSFLFRSFPVIIRIILALLCIAFFTLLVGPQISVLRASVFGLLSYIILLSGKKIRAFSLLLAIGTIFALMNPLILNYDVSFHLSFLAVFGLLFFGDFFTRSFSFLPKWFGFSEALSMCFAAMMLTLPIIVVQFSQVSLISPIANLAIVPVIPVIMLIGFLSIIVSLFSMKVAIMIGFPVWLWLSYVLEMTQWFGNLHYAAIPIHLAEYGNIFQILYFLSLVFVILYCMKEKEAE